MFQSHWLNVAQRWGMVFIALGLCSCLSFAIAQETPAPPEKPAETPAPRETSIYIPYTKLRALFEKDGRGVFIPYEKFQELLKAAQAAAAKLPEIKPQHQH